MIRAAVPFVVSSRAQDRLSALTSVCLGVLVLCSAGTALAQSKPKSSAPATAVAAPAMTVKPQVVATDLSHPWALAFLDGGRMLVTERIGQLRLIEADGKVGQPITGLPKSDANGQGGLLDLIVDSDFKTNRRLYFCYAESEGLRNSTAMASARLSDDASQLEQVKVLFSQYPKYRSNAHFGCRIVENSDGTLFLTLGDRLSRMQDAQTLDNHHGKVVRLNKDGSVPADNPFVAKAKAGDKNAPLPEIWSYGHRNIQGATLSPDGRLWTHEHGAKGGDEINLPEAGKNYGWPVVTHGENYGGGKIGSGKATQAGMEPPLYNWSPSIAPSSMAFLQSERYGKAWQGNLFVGSLKFGQLRRLVLKDGKVVQEEKLLEDLEQRIRDVREGPDGLLYILTDQVNGQLIRLLPQ